MRLFSAMGSMGQGALLGYARPIGKVWRFKAVMVQRKWFLGKE